jgi:hypothetical protein
VKPIKTAALKAWNKRVQAVGQLTPDEAMTAQLRAMILMGIELERRMLAGENGDELFLATVRAFPAAFGIGGRLRGNENDVEVSALFDQVGERFDEEQAADNRRRQLLTAGPSPN